MSLSINEQKNFLSDNLYIESLRARTANQDDIKNFVQATNGNRLANYLTDEAWKDDSCRNTKVFLVRDKTTQQIAFYYALNCGILYTDFTLPNLSAQEQSLVERYVKALRLCQRNDLSSEEQIAADNAYYDVYGEFFEISDDPDRASNLIALADEKALAKEEKEEALRDRPEGDHIKQVKETFPAIDIKFLCKNANYHPSIKLDFKLGIYVFWEIIVPHILKISELAGCKYIYLFAADNTEPSIEEEKPIPMWTPDYDPYDEDDELANPKKDDLQKLVSYYITELKFRPVAEYTILKPHFERSCHTLIQEVDTLQEKREQIWISHDACNEIDSSQE